MATGFALLSVTTCLVLPSQAMASAESGDGLPTVAPKVDPFTAEDIIQARDTAGGYQNGLVDILAKKNITLSADQRSALIQKFKNIKGPNRSEKILQMMNETYFPEPVTSTAVDSSEQTGMPVVAGNESGGETSGEPVDLSPKSDDDSMPKSEPHSSGSDDEGGENVSRDIGPAAALGMGEAQKQDVEKVPEVNLAHSIASAAQANKGGLKLDLITQNWEEVDREIIDPANEKLLSGNIGGMKQMPLEGKELRILRSMVEDNTKRGDKLKTIKGAVSRKVKSFLQNRVHDPIELSPQAELAFKMKKQLQEAEATQKELREQLDKQRLENEERDKELKEVVDEAVKVNAEQEEELKEAKRINDAQEGTIEELDKKAALASKRAAVLAEALGKAAEAYKSVDDSNTSQSGQSGGETQKRAAPVVKMDDEGAPLQHATTEVFDGDEGVDG
ncbi:hypothetical protein OAN22_01935 [Alphaproteobacteria bacterium]|nr:hypothetical protein [Alphaproteobacteria bacterium]